MDARLRITYDKIGDILFIDVCRQHSVQDTDEIDDDVVAKFNRATGAIEFVEILFFQSRLKREGEIRLPAVAAAFRPAAATPNGAAPPSRPNSTLTIGYHRANDILTLHTRPPHPGQRIAGIGEGVTAGMNDATGEIESLAIRGFMARAARDGAVILPISVSLRPVGATVSAD